MLNRLFHAIAAFGVALCTGSALAQDFPQQPVKLIVPYGTGTATDLLGRALSQRLQEIWKQGVVVENVAGAGGVIGTQRIQRAAPDGYTIGLVASGHAMLAALQPNLPYDPIADFTPVMSLAVTPMVIVATPGHYASLKDLVEKARAKPGSIDYGSTGIGSLPHMTVELMVNKAGLKINHIPYRGPGPMQPDLISGRVTLAAQAMSTALPMIASGKLVALAVSTPKRNPQLSDVPSVSEVVPDYDVSPWIALILPKGASPQLVARIRKDVGEAMNAPGVMTAMASLGLDPYIQNGDVFWTSALADVSRWKKLVLDAGIKPE